MFSHIKQPSIQCDECSCLTQKPVSLALITIKKKLRYLAGRYWLKHVGYDLK